MIDIICCWPKDVYYPIFVKQINKNRDLFKRVIIVITKGITDRDYTQYIGEHIKNPTIIKEFEDDGKDWRNAAINKALEYVVSDNVLFLEQDFLVANDFFKKLIERINDYDSFGVIDGNRLHPCCLLTTKKLIDKTKKDFSVDPGIGDHFCKFSQEIMTKGSWITLDSLDLPEYIHLAGLTQNYRLTSNFYDPVGFWKYNQACLLKDMPDEWRDFTQLKMSEVLAAHPEIYYEI